MPEDTLQIKSNFDLTSRSTFSTDDEVFTSRSVAAFLAKSHVPVAHRRIADSFMLIKKVFKFQAVSGRISNADKALLAKYGLMTLEFTTAKQMHDELALLQKWSFVDGLKEDAEEIFEIRVREMKFITSSRYVSNSDEIHKGYIVLENYLKEISKFHN
jgi:hypothetical protein